MTRWYEKLRAQDARRGKPATVPDTTILTELAAYVDQHHGIPPTLRELCNLTGLRSSSTMSYRLESLVGRGLCYAHAPANSSFRRVTITPAGRQWLENKTNERA